MKSFVSAKRFTLHLWVGLAFLALLVFADLIRYPETFFARAVNQVWRAALVVVLNFIFFEYSLPLIRRKRSRLFYNFLIAIPVVFLHLMMYSWGLYAWRLLGIALQIYTPLRVFSSVGHAVSDQMGYSVMSLLFFSVIAHFYDYLRLKQATQQLRIEKQQAELNYLKSQTNPHFLFNTLNNIYSLARDKSDLAPESILRLSKILRFMLYESTGDFISIEQELIIINDYIALERLRYDDTLRVSLHHDIEDVKQALPPLLLIPLVENAFKHGVSETRGQPFVDIHLSIRQRQLMFVVKNSSENFSGDKVQENIGLSNLRRQLELLYKDFNLSVEQRAAVFTASLTINLASHV